MPTESFRSTLRATKGLADPQRIRILMMLRSGELCVCQIIAVLRLAPSTVSKHLSILTAAGLVASRKQGRWSYYRLPDRTGTAAVRQLLKWLDVSLRDDANTLSDARRLKTVVASNLKALCRRQRSRTAEARPTTQNAG